jgi:hypothetical protein
MTPSNTSASKEVSFLALQLFLFIVPAPLKHGTLRTTDRSDNTSAYVASHVAACERKSHTVKALQETALNKHNIAGPKVIFQSFDSAKDALATINQR